MTHEQHFIKTMDTIATTLRESGLTPAEIIGILETLKIDIVLNNNIVTLGGEPLTPADEDVI